MSDEFDNIDFLSNFNPEERELQATIDQILKQELDGGIVKPFTSSNPSVAVVVGGTSRDENLVFLADWIGVIGKEAEFPSGINEQMLEEFASKVSETNGADTWMQVCKNFVNLYGLPDYFINMINKVETILYNSPDDIELKDSINANIMNQISFNVIRHQIKAKEGNFTASMKIIETLYRDFVDMDKQQTLNIVYLYFVSSLCMNQMDNAEEAIKRLWSIVDSQYGQQRVNSGSWDDWACGQIVLWYWMHHVPSALIHFSGALRITNPLYLKQRKRILIKNSSPEFISQLVSEAYYKEACKNFESLPKLI